MEKKTKNKLFVLIILMVGLLSFGVGAATLYFADQVSFIPKNDKWKAKNVEEALNSLYKTYNMGDATAANLSLGKTAFVNGKLITGTGEDTIAAKTSCVEESKKSIEVVSYVVTSLYNGTKKNYTKAGRSIGCDSWTTGNGPCICSNSFSYDSNKINIFETPDGKLAVLSSIIISVTNGSSHTDYSYESASSSSNYRIALEDGTIISSGSTINTTINLFDHTIGENKTLRITASGSIYTSCGTGEYSQGHANAGISTITLTYILL